MTISVRNRHVLMAVVVVVLTALTFGGCLGPAVGEERIASYDVVATIREDRQVEVREVIDWDFGPEARHGIFRTIDTSGGVPEGIEVTSPDAPDEFTESPMGTDIEVKVGDPDRTITGRHRYVISYVLPATIDGDLFALDAVGDRFPVPIEDVTVTVLGAELAETDCFIGAYGSTERCSIEPSGDGYVAAVDRLDPRQGLTVEGTITETRAAAPPDPPPFEDRDAGARLRWAVIVAALGVVTAVAVYVVCRTIGRNEVAGGGATEAAFATGEFGPDEVAPPPGARLVADEAMGELAGIEFVPPPGVEPWQAAVVLREKVDDRTVGSWFSGLTAHDVVTIEARSTTGSTALRPGPRAAEADATVAPILNQAFGNRDEVVLGRYDARFSTAWGQAGRAIEAWATSAQVFRRRPPRYGRSSAAAPAWVRCLIPAVFLVGAGGSSLATGLRTGYAAVAVTIAVVGGLALVAYSVLTRGLTARGSAIALRAESFRRFLHDSEAQHVEWAWQNGLLREYSAWAVALGEATAWNAAMAASSVPPPEVAASSNVLYPALYVSSFSSTTTAPSTSSSGGGGGFSGGISGGFSGGGGGGGGGGSW